MTKKYPPIKKYNPHGAECKGHGMYLTDCTYETQEERDLILDILDHYYPEDETQ